MQAAFQNSARGNTARIESHAGNGNPHQSKLTTRALSTFLSLALGITMCPAAGLAYAAEGEGGEGAAAGSAASAPAGADRVNQDVQLDASGSSDNGSGSSEGQGTESPASSEDGEASEGDAAEAGDASDDASSASSAKYINSMNGQTSADVSLNGGATVGTIECNGLAYTINEGDPSTVSVTGLASAKPAGDVQIPAQIASGGELYAVTAIDIAGISDYANPYAEELFEDSAKALAVEAVGIPSSVEAIDPAFFQLLPNATEISVASDNEIYTGYDGALYSADMTQLILVPQGKGSLVLPSALASVPAYVFSQCDKLSAISFPGSTGNDSFAVRNNILYTSDMTTLLAAPAGLGASAAIAPECKTIAEGAFYGDDVLDTIVVNGVVEEIAEAGETALDANGDALLENSRFNADTATLPAFDDSIVANATVVLNIADEGEGGDAYAALLEQAKAAWAAYGFQSFKEPAEPGTEIEPSEGAGFAFTLLPDYTLSVRWQGEAAEPPAALEIPDYGVIDGVQYTVSTIADEGFSNYTSIITADLPQTITTIGNSAFSGATSLQTIRFDSVTAIGEMAFANTALLSLVLPTTVQAIGDNAFSNMKGATIVALGSIADNSEIALGAASDLDVYVPLGTEDTWDAGIPAYGNHIYPYGVELSQEPLELEVGQTANIADGGYIEAPGDIETNYAYKANPISIDTETGEVEAKQAGSTYIDVSLELKIEQVAVKGVVSDVKKLQPISTDGEEESDIVSLTQKIPLAADAMNAMLFSAEPRATQSITDEVYSGQLRFNYITSGAYAGTYAVYPASTYIIGDIVIPETLNEIKVTTIYDNAFNDCHNITSVSIPRYLTNFSTNGAIENCEKVTSITVDIHNTALKSVDGVLYSKDGKTLIQWPCAKTDTVVKIPYGVEYLGLNAISNNPYIEYIEYPDSLKAIRAYGSYGMSNLKEIRYTSSISSVDLTNHALLTTETWCFPYTLDKVESVTLGNGCNNLSARSFSASLKSLTDIYVEANITSFNTNAFSGVPDKTKVTVHLQTDAALSSKSKWEACGFEIFDSYKDSITDKLTFRKIANTDPVEYSVSAANTDISGDIVIPDKWGTGAEEGYVTTIYDQQFNKCNSMISIFIPEHMNNISDQQPFDINNKLERFIVDPKNQTYAAANGALYSKNFEIMWRWPAGKPDTTVNVVEGCKTIMRGAISNNQYVEHIELPTTIETIDEYMVNCLPALKEINVPDFVSTASMIHSGQSGENDYLLGSLNNLDSVESITFGKGVTAISDFSTSMKSLTDIYVNGNPGTIATTSFSGVPNKAAVIVHLTTDEAIEGREKWENAGFTVFDEYNDSIVNKLEFIKLNTNPVTYKVKPVNKNISGDIIFPDVWGTGADKGFVTTIGDNAFNGCFDIRSVYIPEHMTNISEDGCFELDMGLKYVEVDPDNSAYTAVDGALYTKDLSKLMYWPCGKTDNVVKIAEGCKEVRRGAISNNTYIEYIQCPISLETIDQWFVNCLPNLKELTIPDSVKTATLQNCGLSGGNEYLNGEVNSLDQLTTIRIGATVSHVGEFATSCNNLTSIYVNGDPATIPTNCYSGVPDKSKVTIYLTTEASLASEDKWRAAGFTNFVKYGTYTVTFNTLGGTPVENQTIIKTTEAAKAKDPGPNATTKKGYIFNGWYADTACTQEYDFNTVLTGNITLYAGWSYNTNPSTAEAIKYQTRYHLQKIGRPNPHLEENYDLVEGVGESVTNGYAGMVVSPRQEFAGFGAPGSVSLQSEYCGNTETLVIDFYYLRNSYRFTQGTSPAGITSTEGTTASGSNIQYGVTVSLEAMYFAEGYTFTEWNSSDTSLQPNIAPATNEGGAVTATFTMPAGDITMTPTVQGRTFTIDFVLDNNGVYPDSAPSSWVYNSADITLGTPARLGYTFVGWTISDAKEANTIEGNGTTSCTIGKNTLPASGASITATAAWAVNTYAINFDANGGTGAANPTSMQFTIETSPAPKLASAGTLSSTEAKTGYHFTGWNSAANGSGADYTPSASISIAAFIADTQTANAWIVAGDNSYTTTLYADWEENTYDIRFNRGMLDGSNGLPGGSAPDVISGLSYTEKVTFPANTFTQQGYTFTAWDVQSGTKGTDSAGAWAATGADAPSVTVADIVARATELGKTITNDVSGNSITLFANWNASKYTISYAAGDNTDTVTLPHGISALTYTQIVEGDYEIAAPLDNTLGYVSNGWSLVNAQDNSKNDILDAGESLHNNSFATYFNGNIGDETIKLTAAWTEKTFTVKLDKNASGAAYASGATEPATITKKYTEAISLPVDVNGDGAGKTEAGIEYVGWNLDGWKAAADSATQISASKMSDVVAAVAAVSAAQNSSIVGAAEPAITVYAVYGAGANSYVVHYSYQSIDDGEYPDSMKVPGVSSSDVRTNDKVVIDDVIDKGRPVYNGYTYVLDKAKSAADLGEKTIAGDSAENEWTVYYKLVLTVNYENSDASKGSLEDESGNAATSAEFDWGASLVLPQAKTKNVAAYRFAGWQASPGAPEVEDGTLVKLDGETYTAKWENVKYTIKHDYFDSTKPETAELHEDHVYTWAALDDAICEMPTVNPGGKFVAWHKEDGSVVEIGDPLKDVLFGTGSIDGDDVEAKLFLEAEGKTYVVKFWMFEGNTTDSAMLGAGGQPIVREVTFGGDAVAMPKQAEIADDCKLYGYLVSGFTAKNGAKVFDAELSPDIGDTLPLDVADMIDKLGDKKDGGVYNLFAKWNAVYKVSVPTSEIAMSIDPTTCEAIVSNIEVKVENDSPKAIYLGAYANISDSDMEKTKYLFLGSKTASDDALNGVNFVFCDENKPFSVNGGEASAVAYDAPIGGVAAVNGEVVTRLSMTGFVKLLLPENIWSSLAASTGELLSMKEADFAALGLTGVTRGDTSVSWGKIATITWVISQTGTGESFDMETGKGSASHGPFSNEAGAYETTQPAV